MEKYEIKDVRIEVEDKVLAKIETADVLVGPTNIEVNLPKLELSNETLGLLRLAMERKSREFTISGRINNETLVVENALIYNMGMNMKVGEIVVLRDIRILGLNAKFIYSK